MYAEFCTASSISIARLFIEALLSIVWLFRIYMPLDPFATCRAVCQQLLLLHTNGSSTRDSSRYCLLVIQRPRGQSNLFSIQIPEEIPMEMFTQHGKKKSSYVAARVLATYLIPGCVGRGVRLGSENSSGAAGAGAGGVWKSGLKKKGACGNVPTSSGLPKI